MNMSVPKPHLYNIPAITDQFNGMPYRPLGRSGLRVANVGLGTWKFGYPETGDGSRVDERSAFAIFDKAVELGVTFWDTANRYNAASGNSERIIGKWFRQNLGQRRNIILATKVGNAMDGRTPNHGGLARISILDSVYACLERLQIERIDLLYFHRFDAATPAEESLAAIDDLMRQDLVRYFGVSNFTVAQIVAYQDLYSRFGIRVQIVAVQNQYDILHGECQTHADVLQHALETGISFIAWSPLALGLLTERYLDSSRVGTGDRLYDEKRLAQYADAATMRKVHILAELANVWDLKISQLVLAYMLSLPGMGPVIPSSTTVDQLIMNAKAGTIRLTDEQLRQIREALATG